MKKIHFTTEKVSTLPIKLKRTFSKVFFSGLRLLIWWSEIYEQYYILLLLRTQFPEISHSYLLFHECKLFEQGTRTNQATIGTLLLHRYMVFRFSLACYLLMHIKVMHSETFWTKKRLKLKIFYSSKTPKITGLLKRDEVVLRSGKRVDKVPFWMYRIFCSFLVLYAPQWNV